MGNSVPPLAADLIESLSEDRARLLEEKKRLEEEVSRLRGGAFVPSPGVAAAPELYGACAPEAPVEALDTLGEGRPDSAMETSTMCVQSFIDAKAGPYGRNEGFCGASQLQASSGIQRPLL